MKQKIIMLISALMLMVVFAACAENDPVQVYSFYDNGEYHWRFISEFTNDTGAKLTFQRLEIMDIQDGKNHGSTLLGAAELPDIRLETLPGERFGFVDYHPVVDYFNGRRYIYTFTDEAGNLVAREFAFDLHRETSPFPPTPVDEIPAYENAIQVYPFYDSGENHWRFLSEFVNNSGSKLTFRNLEIMDLVDGSFCGSVFRTADQLYPGFQTEVPAGQMFWFDDYHPVVERFNGRRYIFNFVNEAGETVIKEFLFALHPAEVQTAAEVPVEIPDEAPAEIPAEEAAHAVEEPEAEEMPAVEQPAEIPEEAAAPAEAQPVVRQEIIDSAAYPVLSGIAATSLLMTAAAVTIAVVIG